jgi:hypothetical protein
VRQVGQLLELLEPLFMLVVRVEMAVLQMQTEARAVVVAVLRVLL